MKTSWIETPQTQRCCVTSLEIFTHSFLHRAQSKTRGLARGSRSFSSVAAHIISWPPVSRSRPYGQEEVSDQLTLRASRGVDDLYRCKSEAKAAQVNLQSISNAAQVKPSRGSNYISPNPSLITSLPLAPNLKMPKRTRFPHKYYIYIIGFII